MPFFYRNSILYCDNFSILDIAKRINTPFYIYSADSFIEQLEKLKRMLEGIDSLICYSIKSNSNINIVKLLSEADSGFDIVSGGELYRALKAGVKPSKIVFAGVGKSYKEIEYAISKNIFMFNAESFNEIKLINRIAIDHDKSANISIRINPDIAADTHSHITTGKKENKFGLLVKDIFSSIDELKSYKNINLIGLHCHIGSQITTSDTHLMALDILLETATKLEKHGFPIENINIGGGFGIAYMDDDKEFPFIEFGKGLRKRLSRKRYRLIIEPGRFISGNSGLLISRLIYRKITSTKIFYVLDTAMNDLIRPALYNAYHKIMPVVIDENRAFEDVDIVGPICETGDTFAMERSIRKCYEREILAIFGTGAYGFAMSSNYNSRLKPHELMVKNGELFIIRNSDEYQDLIYKEVEQRLDIFN